MLPDKISSNQSAFVAGRSIVQNIQICQDMVRLYTTRSCLIKIDIRKAYDSVEAMLRGLNFPHVFITWIMECVTTTRYSIALNGGIFGCIEGNNPISPLLFVIWMEYFSRIMIYVPHEMQRNEAQSLMFCG